MEYYEFKVDSYLKFNSMHYIDTDGWKPKLKLLYDYDLILVKNNRIKVLCNSINHEVNPREVFFAHPGQTTYIKPYTGSKTGVSVLHFSCNYCIKKTVNYIFETYKDLKNQPDTNNTLFLSTHMKLKYDYVFEILKVMFSELKYRRLGYKRKLDICLHELLYELHRSCIEDVIFGNVKYNYNISNIYTRKIIDYIHNNFMNKITGKNIENLLDLSYDYANLTFKRMTGFTIMDYLYNLRMTRAKDLINSTSLKLQEIALRVGFRDPHYFSKKFKAFEGISPSEYKDR